MSISDRPTALELVEAVRGYLTDDVIPGTEGRISFHGRVAANVLAQVAREIELGPALDAAHQARLAALGAADEGALAAAIRNGDFDDRYDELVAALRADVLDKLAIANPGYVDQ